MWALRNFATCFTKPCNMEEINERKEETGTGQQKGMLRDVLKLSLRCWQVGF